MDPVWAGITEKRPFLRWAKKCLFGQKCFLTPKSTQHFLRDWYLFWKRPSLSLALHVFFNILSNILWCSFLKSNPLTQATIQCVLSRFQMFPEAKLNDKWNGIEEGKVELGRRDKLNSPPPSPSLSASLPPCLNHHHLYNLSQINYILSHLLQTFLVLKILILLAVVSLKIILTDWEGVISNCGKTQKWCICWVRMLNGEV